jgi:hypothetical protein
MNERGFLAIPVTGKFSVSIDPNAYWLIESDEQLSLSMHWDSFSARFEFVQIIGPLLHHLAPLR